MNLIQRVATKMQRSSANYFEHLQVPRRLVLFLSGGKSGLARIVTSGVYQIIIAIMPIFTLDISSKDSRDEVSKNASVMRPCGLDTTIGSLILLY